MLNAKPETQSKITSFVSELDTGINVALYDLRLADKDTHYTLAAIMSSDLVIYERPDMHTWLTGFIVALPHCYYLEYDAATVNTLYEISLRQIDETELTGIIEHAIQRKYSQTLQLLPAQSKRST